MLGDEDKADKDLGSRIKELNDKFTQILLFLSFSLISGATLENNHELWASNPSLLSNLNWSLFWWKVGVLMALVGVLPVKEMGKFTRYSGAQWYSKVVWAKVLWLWLTIAVIFVGGFLFLRAS